ncbi:MAG: hypothetical protein C0468_01315 [Planctomyces sp.]|nr:hypothetical protein [Planctomyces sp.]MBA4120341.1 hypothetical protein [Isosphaera sp.]
MADRAQPSPAGLTSAGLPLVIFTLLSWASIPLFIRLFREPGWGLDPYAANGWRYGVSAALWLPYLLWRARRGELPARLLRLALVPVAFNIVGQTFFAWGPTLLEPGFFSFVFRVQIVFVTLGAYLLFPGERGVLRSWRYWAGTAGVVAGSVGLIFFAAEPPKGATLVGVMVAMASGVLFAGYGLSVRYCVGSFNPVTAFGVICQMTAVGMIGVMAAMVAAGRSDWTTPIGWSAGQVAVLVASAFIGIAISHVTYYMSLGRLGVALTIGVIQLQPVLTAVGSFLIFDERLRWAQWLSGTVGVLGAVVMLSARPRVAGAGGNSEDGGSGGDGRGPDAGDLAEACAPVEPTTPAVTGHGVNTAASAPAPAPARAAAGAVNGSATAARSA